jgi:gluconolactonase
MKPIFQSAACFVIIIFTACETPAPPTPIGNGANVGPPPTLNGKRFPTLGEVQRLDSALDRLIAPEARIERLAEGFDWAEGPVWVRTSQGKEFLLFSDIPPNKIFQWSEAGGLKLFLHPSGYTGATPRGGEPGSNGLLLDRFGRLLLCQHGDRQIARLGISLSNPRPVYETIVDKYKGKRFNSPNDACFNKNGDLYFTDPPYGLEKRLKDPKKELSFQGVFLLNKDGEVKLLTDKIAFPNGIALSPDEKILYVAESGPDTKIHAFNIQADGTIDEGRLFFDPAPLKAAGQRGDCDGLKIDEKGNLFATGPGGVLVITPQGKHLGTISTGTRIANVGWGNDGRTLYLTANNLLCRIRTLTKGAGFGFK